MQTHPTRPHSPATSSREVACEQAPSLPVHTDGPGTGARAEQVERNQAAIRLLAEWKADDSGYDEATWPLVEKRLKENPLSLGG